MEMDDLMDFASATSRQAGEIAMSHFGVVAVERKGDGSEVTAADRASEEFLKKSIAEAFPDDAILGEEGTTVAGRSGRRWIIDPIDATRSFASGVPLFGVQLHRARGCDVLVTSAGVSVGEHDLVRRVLSELGLRTAFWRVRIRPGSPVAFGWVDSLDRIPWFGLPGNPVSSMVTFELFVRPALLRMAGHRAVFAPTVRVRIAEEVAPSPGLEVLLRATLSGAEPPVATLTGPQGSGLLSSMSAADALVLVPEAGAAAGSLLPAILLGGAPFVESPLP